MKDEVTTTLKRARQLILDPRGWCRGYLSQFRHDGDGLRYCALGAIGAATSSMTFLQALASNTSARKELKAACSRLFNMEIEKVNDQEGHSAIILAFDVAIGEPSKDAIHEPSAEERNKVVEVGS